MRSSSHDEKNNCWLSLLYNNHHHQHIAFPCLRVSLSISNRDYSRNNRTACVLYRATCCCSSYSGVLIACGMLRLFQVMQSCTVYFFITVLLQQHISSDDPLLRCQPMASKVKKTCHQWLIKKIYSLNSKEYSFAFFLHLQVIWIQWSMNFQVVWLSCWQTSGADRTDMGNDTGSERERERGKMEIRLKCMGHSDFGMKWL